MHLLAFAETIQLFPDGTLLLHIGMILGMIWVLNRTLYRPIHSIIEARHQQRGGHSLEADKILREVEEREKLYAKEMLDARSKGYELIEQEQKQAVAEREKNIGEAKAETAQSLNSNKAELEKQVASARAVIDAEAEKIADSIAASILKG